ncbi:hypothetical protein Tco_0764439 [Tanacetum coccineum]
MALKCLTKTMWAPPCCPGKNPLRAFPSDLSRATCCPGKPSKESPFEHVPKADLFSGRRVARGYYPRPATEVAGGSPDLSLGIVVKISQMPEARDRLSRLNDVVEAYAHRRMIAQRFGILPDESEDERIPIRWGSMPLTGEVSGQQMGLTQFDR